jgi:hypothetical protein
VAHVEKEKKCARIPQMGVSRNSLEGHDGYRAGRPTNCGYRINTQDEYDPPPDVAVVIFFIFFLTISVKR